MLLSDEVSTAGAAVAERTPMAMRMVVFRLNILKVRNGGIVCARVLERRS